MIAMHDNAHLYAMHEMHHAAMAPVHFMANASKHMLHSPLNPLGYTLFGRSMAAGAELVERLTTRFSKPAFGICDTVIDGKTYAVEDLIVDSKPFCNLLHFRKSPGAKQPVMLVVAPMSGHYATLLRGTIRDMLPHFDIYVTDWLDARDVPIYEGEFNLNSYIDYTVDFLRKLGRKSGGGIHVLAVCQPAVPVFAAATLMAQREDPFRPASITLIGGPIDTRKAPTAVNQLASQKPLEWFEQHAVTRVPMNYPGFMRRVYPGFLQLTGFMTMNLERHVGEHIKLFQHLVQGDGDSAVAHREFYDEYLAVMDITAEFYLQTVEEVFQKHSIPERTFEHDGIRLDPRAITDTGILCLEGERDDISGLGQTKAALGLCPNLPTELKRYHMQKGVGHYGIFNGRKFREFVLPIIIDFAQKAGQAHA